MKRIDVYNAYNVNHDFRHIANALGFTGFEYEPEDDDFEKKLENDDELGDLLEQLEYIESSQFLIYTCTTTEFYNRYEYDILDYLENNGYNDNYSYGDNNELKSIKDIMHDRVIYYVTSVISEYDY